MDYSFDPASKQLLVWRDLTPEDERKLTDKKFIPEIILQDPRKITRDQQKQIYATFNDTSSHTGYAPSETKDLMKFLYIADEGGEWFSLANISVDDACAFQAWLAVWCVEQCVPTLENPADRAAAPYRVMYAQTTTRQCAICGRKADIHEVDRVGMGRDRRKMHHLGQRVQPLCRRHHCEVDELGQQTFDQKYHLGTVTLDEYLCRLIGWKI